MHPRRANAARFGDAFETRRDVDAVAHQIAVRLLDHVAQVNPDAELDALVGGQAGVAPGHRTLHIDCAPYCVDHAAELHDTAIAGALNDATAVQRQWLGR